MSKFIFVSDFDNTFTNKDFYKVIMDKYMTSNHKKELLDQWKKRNVTNFEFLRIVFAAMDKSEEQLLDEIMGIEINHHAVEFMNKIISKGWDVVILSGGADYYIHKVLNHFNINKGIQVIANKGIYKDGHIELIADVNSLFYSQGDGIDKLKVVKTLKKDHQLLCFAGDSAPDFQAAMAADITFAKDRLQTLLQDASADFIKIDNFAQIDWELTKRGLI